jgi:hypothetical protein
MAGQARKWADAAEDRSGNEQKLSKVMLERDYVDIHRMVVRGWIDAGLFDFPPSSGEGGN